jgi:hypothetical protein
MKPALAPNAHGSHAENSGDKRSRAERDEDRQNLSRRRRRRAEGDEDERRTSGELAESAEDPRSLAEDGEPPPPPTRPNRRNHAGPTPPAPSTRSGRSPRASARCTSPAGLYHPGHTAPFLCTHSVASTRACSSRGQPGQRCAARRWLLPYSVPSRPRWAACTLHKRLTEGRSQTKRTSAAALGKDYRALAENGGLCPTF